MDRLYEFMIRQLDRVDGTFHRYVYDAISWENRMLGLVGPRGVGKTTLFLQRIKEHHSVDDTLYVTADHLYFADHSLLETAEAFAKSGGRFLFIDEVHKYPNWSRELKMMFDSLPDVRVYFTGSSVLDIEKGEADLSRRAPKYAMPGLSFREYLAIRHGIEAPLLSIDDIVAHREGVPGVDHPLPLFKDYLKRGYYPFGSDVDFDIELGQVIARTLEVDIPQFAGMTAATGRKLKKLMAIVSTLVPFKPNMTSLGSQIQASRNNIEDYLGYMEKAGMIAQLRGAEDGLAALGKVEKVYLDNTNILYNLSDGAEDVGTVRETFFLNQTRVGHAVSASRASDFQIGDMTFEVGGKSKGRDQLKGTKRGFVVKDDIERGFGNVLPLWAFGLLY
ncbi:ATP-binding protein [uncultured Enorma sp.]|uniref:ATP-binding protein n=1 Tax=uncultured Enorma sp. TaxID=1714346 RepID=UPI0026221E13|nr:AAA family ATPase [uncultured Enorma sp.]